LVKRNRRAVPPSVPPWARSFWPIRAEDERGVSPASVAPERADPGQPRSQAKPPHRRGSWSGLPGRVEHDALPQGLEKLAQGVAGCEAAGQLGHVGPAASSLHMDASGQFHHVAQTIDCAVKRRNRPDHPMLGVRCLQAPGAQQGSRPGNACPPTRPQPRQPRRWSSRGRSAPKPTSSLTTSSESPVGSQAMSASRS